jgi:hypothetical protein
VLGQVAAFGGDLPLVVGLDQDSAGQAEQGLGVGKDADDVSSSNSMPSMTAFSTLSRARHKMAFCTPFSALQFRTSTSRKTARVDRAAQGDFTRRVQRAIWGKQRAGSLATNLHRCLTSASNPGRLSVPEFARFILPVRGAPAPPPVVEAEPHPPECPDQPARSILGMAALAAGTRLS